MILLDKWDYARKEYLPYMSPANHLVFYTENMDEKTDCASCGKTITFGVGFSSKEIHNHSGLGFSVCSDCHKLELIRAKENES